MVYRNCLTRETVFLSDGDNPVPASPKSRRQLARIRDLTARERTLIEQIVRIEHKLETEQGTWQNRDARKKTRKRLADLKQHLRRETNAHCTDGIMD